MNKAKIQSINKERLDGWCKKLTDRHATPQILIGVGHDRVQGQIVVCVPENGPTDFEMLLLMKETVRQLEQSIALKN